MAGNANSGPKRPFKPSLLKSRVASRTAGMYNALHPSDPILCGYKQSVLLSTLQRHNGKLTACAKALNMSLKSLENCIKKSKILQEEMIGFNEAELDLAEEKLTEQITKGNLSAIQFMLKCKGKERGWTEKSELSIEMTKPITFKYTVAKPKEEKK